MLHKYIELLEYRHSLTDQPVNNLSGGNQQKVILARWLAIKSRALILDEPTRGIDVGSKAEIQKLILTLLKKENPVCLFPQSWKKYCAPATGSLFLREREKVAEFSGEVDEKTIIQAIAGVNYEKIQTH